MLNLMYITKHPEIARIAEEAGVDWIFVDMEFIGKDCRQGGLDTVQNHHTVEDVANIRAAVTKAKVLVRINHIHDTMDDYPEAADLLDQIVEIDGIDMIHIGLNDMHLALKMKFMFQLLTDGSVDKWTRIIAQKGIMYGFGGLASLNGGAVPGRMILKEHYRLGSQMVIVSRAFCNTDNMTDLDKVRSIFNNGIADIRKMENEMNKLSKEDFKNNHKAVCDAVGIIVKK